MLFSQLKQNRVAIDCETLEEAAAVKVLQRGELSRCNLKRDVAMSKGDCKLSHCVA
jgi:hypothetical protein